MKFFGRNNDRARKSFEERAFYKEYAFSDISSRLDLSDFLYGNPLYGRVDNKGCPIYPNEAFLKTYESEDEVFGLDFVVDAYYAFRKSFRIEANERNLTNRVKTRLLNLSPVRGYTSLSSDYFFHQEDLFNEFFTIISDNGLFRKKMCNFKTFLSSYFWFLERLVKIVPITKPGYTLSRYCTPNISGLIIDLEENANADNDAKKKSRFLDDPLFDAYVTKAAQYGFSVDKNVPSRLVARINEPPMKFFMSLNDSYRETFFEKYYLKSYIGDYNDFKTTSVDMYNSFIEAFPTETYAEIFKDTLVVKQRDRYYANEQDILDMGEIYWFKKYFHIRFTEHFGTGKKDKMRVHLKRLVKFHRTKGIEKTLNKMEKIFLKHPRAALPKIRKEMYNYGILNTTSGIYSGKPNNNEPDPSPKKKTSKPTSPANSGGGSSSY